MGFLNGCLTSQDIIKGPPQKRKLTLAGILLFNSMTGIMEAPFLVKKYTVGFWFPGTGFHSTALPVSRRLENKSNPIGGTLHRSGEHIRRPIGMLVPHHGEVK